MHTLAVIVTALAAATSSADPRSQAAANKALIQRWYDEVHGKVNLDFMDQAQAADCIVHNLGQSQILHSTVETKQWVGSFQRAFTDRKVTVDDLIAEGDRVVSRWTFRGTHNAPLGDIPATGKSVTLEGMTIWRIAGRKIVEVWNIADRLGLMRQLGALPEK